MIQDVSAAEQASAGSDTESSSPSHPIVLS